MNVCKVVKNLTLALLFIVEISYAQINLDPSAPYHTYFQYTNEELNDFNDFEPINSQLYVKQIKLLDNQLMEILSSNKILSTDLSRIFSYYYMAQLEMINLSLNSKKKIAVDFSFLAKLIICEFYPNQCTHLPLIEPIIQDKFSEILAKTVLKKIQHREFLESKANKNSAISLNRWPEYFKLYSGSINDYKPWLIRQLSNYLAPDPKNFLPFKVNNTLLEQKQSVLPNQGNRYTNLLTEFQVKMFPMYWLKKFNELIEQDKYPIEYFIKIRSFFAMGLLDSILVSNHNKLTYHQSSPVAMGYPKFPPIEYYELPSYVSTESCVASYASTFITKYFPNQVKTVEDILHNISNRQLNNNLSFDHDVSQAIILGSKVSEEIISDVENS